MDVGSVRTGLEHRGPINVGLLARVLSRKHGHPVLARRQVVVGQLRAHVGRHCVGRNRAVVLLVEAAPTRARHVPPVPVAAVL